MKRVVFDENEFAAMIILTARADPDRWADDTTKALIYKCRSFTTVRRDGTVALETIDVSIRRTNGY